MNKLLKGSIAGAAGIVLLLGGAGTLAYWNDSANLTNAGSISSGVLNVEADAAAPGSWNNSISLIVPGDTRTFTQSLDLAATGDNLKFTVSSNIADLVTAGGITGATVTPTFVVKNGATVVTPVAGVYTVAAGADYSIDASIVVAFPSTVTGLTGQGQTMNLGAAAVTVTQVAP